MTPPKSKAAWLVVIDGAGEIDTDFSTIVYKEETAPEALQRALDGGYGKEIAYVIPIEHVQAFKLGERRSTTAEPTTFHGIVASTPVASRQYLDPDGTVRCD